MPSTPFPVTRTLASGSVALLDPTTGRVTAIVAADDDADQEVEGPTCSLCDAVGHGYPGAGPCPLEG